MTTGNTGDRLAVDITLRNNPRLVFVAPSTPTTSARKHFDAPNQYLIILDMCICSGIVTCPSDTPTSESNVTDRIGRWEQNGGYE